jgi:hypothetical protein
VGLFCVERPRCVTTDRCLREVVLVVGLCNHVLDIEVGTTILWNGVETKKAWRWTLLSFP